MKLGRFRSSITSADGWGAEKLFQEGNHTWIPLHSQPPGHIIPPEHSVCPWVHLVGLSMETFKDHTPDPPQLTPLDLVEQQVLTPSLRLSAVAHLYLGSQSFCRGSYLMTTGEGRNEARADSFGLNSVHYVWQEQHPQYCSSIYVSIQQSDVNKTLRHLNTSTWGRDNPRLEGGALFFSCLKFANSRRLVRHRL